ncbi:MAG: RNase adapter RapZ, partial [Terracidiphilus sp.]
MTPSKPAHRAKPPRAAAKRAKQLKKPNKELVIVTGISGAGKASALKAFEDLGFHAVDNLPLELLPDFAGLVVASSELEKAAIVVDIREGTT